MASRPAKPVTPVRRSRQEAAAPTKPSRRKATGNAKPRPLKALSPAYRKRLQAYAKKHGVSLKTARSAARGHAPAPATATAPALTESQKRRIREQGLIDAFARQQATKFQNGMSASEIAAVLREQVKLKGMRWFQKLRAEIAGYHQAYMDQPYGAKGHGWRPALGIDMDTLEKKYELSREVMGYH